MHLLLLHPWTRNWLRFRSGAIDVAWNWILTKQRLRLADAGLWTIHVDLVLSRVSIRASPNLDIRGIKFYSKLTFEHHVSRISVDTCITTLLSCICSLNPRVLFFGVGVRCCLSPSASWGQVCSVVMLWPDIIVSCYCVIDVMLSLTVHPV